MFLGQLSSGLLKRGSLPPEYAQTPPIRGEERPREVRFQEQVIENYGGTGHRGIVHEVGRGASDARGPEAGLGKGHYDGDMRSW